MLDKGMVHVLEGTEQDSVRFCQATQNGTQFRSYEVFISRIFHLIFLDFGWPQVTEAMESKTSDKRDGGLL